ncbi:MAG: hypothetical protein H7A45_05970 [Verrucomicrobiales bacterium]|nr:hypothetical protein [Verrucomicrobiales bacterium]
MRFPLLAPCAAAAALAILPKPTAGDAAQPTWPNGPASDPAFFPIAVWLQSPANASRYRAAGINTYVGLWRGPTEEQLASLKAAGMRVICDQNAVGLAHRNDPTIIGWMHGDEPDNAQALPDGKGYGPPIPPERIIADYQRIQAADPTRPVLLNLGQGVAWDGWHGRGVRTNHPEDYPEYARGGDIISFDIYPACHSHPEVAGNLSFVGRGVARLVDWTGGGKIIWNCIECTRIQNPTTKATPAQVRAEVWMSIIHGSRGLIYFVHEWEPRFREAALLDDPEMLAMVTGVNHQVTRLAPVIHAEPDAGNITVETTPAEAAVAWMARRHAGRLHLFAVGMQNGPVEARFTGLGFSGTKDVEVIDESRTLSARDGRFTDRFAPWEVHLYRIPE